MHEQPRPDSAMLARSGRTTTTGTISYWARSDYLHTAQEGGLIGVGGCNTSCTSSCSSSRQWAAQHTHARHNSTARSRQCPRRVLARLSGLAAPQRYTTRDPTFMSWGLAPGKSTFTSRENGGQPSFSMPAQYSARVECAFSIALR